MRMRVVMHAWIGQIDRSKKKKKHGKEKREKEGV